MNNGILFIAFGEKYYRMAIKTIEYSRKYTKLPFFIITNIKENKFEKIENTKIMYSNLDTTMNRHIKTSMINYTPFDSTIYMDCDSVIQKEGIEKSFELLSNNDIMLNVFGKWERKNSLSYYRNTMDILNEHFPITIYYGAFIGFNKNNNSYTFFKQWNENWKKSGIAREMPALACTIKQMTNLKVKALSLNENIFSWKVNKNSIVQHEYGNSNSFWNTYFPGVLY